LDRNGRRCNSECASGKCDFFCTTGKTLRLFRNGVRCPAPRAKIFNFPKFGIRALCPAVPCSDEGASRSSRTSSAGCDGRGHAARRAAGQRTVKPCGPDPPTLGSSRSRSIDRRRGLTSPVPRGEHGVSRKAIAQGVPDCSALPVVTTLVCFFHMQARLRVRPAPGIPCALCFPEGHDDASPRARSCRGRADLCLNRRNPVLRVSRELS
jgi:hypothetical protein